MSGRNQTIPEPVPTPVAELISQGKKPRVEFDPAGGKHYHFDLSATGGDGGGGALAGVARLLLPAFLTVVGAVSIAALSYSCTSAQASGAIQERMDNTREENKNQDAQIKALREANEQSRVQQSQVLIQLGRMEERWDARWEATSSRLERLEGAMDTSGGRTDGRRKRE